MSFAVTNFYKFVTLSKSEVDEVRLKLMRRGAALNLRGLIVLATEGINATVVGDVENIAEFKRWLTEESPFTPLTFKDSQAKRMPFRRFKIDVRPEIVTFGHATASAEEMRASMLSPREWHERMCASEAPVVIDLRNAYETALGTFRAAIDPHIDVFTDFPAFIEQANLPRDREVLMYCTGGIRCEKALGFMREKGFTKARQLAGGILRYLEEFPEGAFAGECFVFDHRVAVDQELQPTKRYKLCVQCGNPAKEVITCRNCGTLGAVCKLCCSDSAKQACSKNCAYHLRRKAARKPETNIKGAS